MSLIVHDAILVTTRDRELFNELLTQVAFLCLLIGASLFPRSVNGYYTLVVCPDGGKEGEPCSNEGDIQRKKFIEWMESQRCEDGSTSLEWVSVAYGNGIKTALVTGSAWGDPAQVVLPNPPTSELPLFTKEELMQYGRECAEAQRLLSREDSINQL